MSAPGSSSSAHPTRGKLPALAHGLRRPRRSIPAVVGREAPSGPSGSAGPGPGRRLASLPARRVPGEGRGGCRAMRRRDGRGAVRGAGTGAEPGAEPAVPAGTWGLCAPGALRPPPPASPAARRRRLSDSLPWKPPPAARGHALAPPPVRRGSPGCAERGVRASPRRQRGEAPARGVGV